MKKLYIFAGVNGAGKSTFYFNQLENNFYGARINSDEIVKEIGDYENPQDQNRAGRLAIKLRNSYLEKGIDFNLETTLCGNSIIKFIEKARKKDFFITLFYVGLENVEISKQRVAIRVAKKGHNIDEKTLERRFSLSFANLAKIINLCDIIYFYDNSCFIEKQNKQKLTNFKMIAKKENNCIFIENKEEIKWFNNVLNKINKEIFKIFKKI